MSTPEEISPRTRGARVSRKRRTGASKAKIQSKPEGSRRPEERWICPLALLVGIIPAVMVYFQADGFNGPFYWKWNYSSRSVLPFLGLALLAGVAVFLAYFRLAARGRYQQALAVLTLTHLFLSLSLVTLAPDSLRTVENRVKHPDITSYYLEALKIDHLTTWLDQYDEKLPTMIGHAQTHPPGPIVYFYFWSSLLGVDGGAFWGGLFIEALAAFGILPLFLLTRSLTGDDHMAFCAAVVWTLLPAILLMMGSLDTAYPTLTILLLYFWTQAIWRGGRASAAAFAVTLCIALFCTHSFLVLGACFLLLAGFGWLYRAERNVLARDFLYASGISLAIVVLVFGLALALLGYDHVAALRQSMRMQEGLAQLLARPYRYTVFWDIYDYFLASGWITFGILLAFLYRWRSHPDDLPAPVRAFAAAGLLSLLLVDVTGLLRAEAARVWLFLQPLVIPLVGIELARWPAFWRHAAVGTMLVILAIIRARLNFV